MGIRESADRGEGTSGRSLKRCSFRTGWKHYPTRTGWKHYPTVTSWKLIAVVGLVAVAWAATPVWAGKFNPTLNIGDKAPEWKELPGVDGKKHSSADLASKEFVVVVFTCNTCPTAEDYEDRIIALTKKVTADGKGVVVAINSNKVADDLLPKMEERAKAKKFNFPYLHDETQGVAKAFGATVTPEFFVLNKERKVVYMGALDDSTDPAKVQEKYVETAIAATLAGKAPETTETVARGCLVRFARDRKKK